MLSSIPFFVLSHYFVTPKIGDLITVVSTYTWAGDLTITAAGVFLMMQASRWISKPFFEDRIFKNGSEFPTTNFLLFSDRQYSKDYTNQIHEKIATDFNITLHTEREEAENLNEARQRIKEAVSLMRNTVGDNGLVLQHNIEYGFVRNLAGGTVIALLITSVSLLLFYFAPYNETALILSIVLFVIYSIYLLLSGIVIRYVGNNYADVLITEYMNSRVK